MADLHPTRFFLVILKFTLQQRYECGKFTFLLGNMCCNITLTFKDIEPRNAQNIPEYTKIGKCVPGENIPAETFPL